MGIYGNLIITESFLKKRKEAKLAKQEQRRKEAAESAAQDAVKVYKQFIKWWNNPTSLRYAEIYGLINLLKIPDNKVVSKLVKTGRKINIENLVNYNWDDDGTVKISDVVAELKQYIKSDDAVVLLSGDGDDGWYYIADTKSLKIYFVLFEGSKPQIKSSSIKDIADNMCDLSNESFIEADKRLGYYKLSSPPSGTTPNKLTL